MAEIIYVFRDGICIKNSFTVPAGAVDDYYKLFKSNKDLQWSDKAQAWVNLKKHYKWTILTWGNPENAKQTVTCEAF